MEKELHARDKVGLQDFVLLEDYTNIDAFIDNLDRRFKEDLIYTYIGPVLVTVNPYKATGLYSEEVAQVYRNINFYEEPPHIFAVADTAYRTMLREHRDQCVLISGESGAGKTEASKQILQHIASTCVNHSTDVERVKDRLLQSNPILEAFGNAKTNRNDNSSRFGKYMDIEFDFKGAPTGGVIVNYLLEKSRLCQQAAGERNFHVFYQLLAGAGPETLEALELTANTETYFYLTQASEAQDNSRDDTADYSDLTAALDVCHFSADEQAELLQVVAAVLHLGNLGFIGDAAQATIKDFAPAVVVAKLLGCDDSELCNALTQRTISTFEEVSTPLTRDQAISARDALAKAIYERLFSWMVRRINTALVSADSETSHNVLGLLDVYGFEIFKYNSFEQFCINYCNEKLQQLFISLTLRSEQEEYLKEGIEWEPVTYFDNKIICELVESKPYGIIALLDEECLRPGDPTDASFLKKMSGILKRHPHFLSHETTDFQGRKTIRREEFRLVHYAGEVTYSVNGFLEKNSDLLFRDLKQVMASTKNSITSACFSLDELDSKKRPETVVTQFKGSLGALMEALLFKEPSYVRCIKPNDEKNPGVFMEEIVRHQVKYLGLMENLRVRRAGFAYRRPYDIFLRRYKSLCPATWPNYSGPAREGVQLLCDHLEYDSNNYKMGKTKIFIRFPRVLFTTEDKLQLRKEELAASIQAMYKGVLQQRKYLKLRAAVTKIASIWRMYQAKQLLQRRRKAAHLIGRFARGFLRRAEPDCDENRIFVMHMKRNFLLRMKDRLPVSVLDDSWIQAPATLTETSHLLRVLHTKNLAIKYCKGISAERKQQLTEKVVAEKLFQSKNALYTDSIAQSFLASTLGDAPHETAFMKYFLGKVKPNDEDLIYSHLVTKYDRTGYQTRKRYLLVTNNTIYVHNVSDFKAKERINMGQIKEVSVSVLRDDMFVDG
ncbi:hypothetical protein NP493_899g00038 [Ridgeia piscesae]|uniref:Uncharacterized protein n=1 Tax=Ridgeia piscesae TaxID=27915 RepID=A0AAD9KLZ8_RIDPI|nr:hypothetical protein NP493_899g00038 [Ridgeia piscesae]